MDDTILKRGIQALQWEANYRKMADKAGSNHFLAAATNLDSDFEKYLSELNILEGKALDIGTGTGEQAIFLAKRGFEVTATDVSQTAIESARKSAALFTAHVTFVEDNILETRLQEQFDLIIDRGCFTILPADYKQDYFLAVKKLLKVNGWLFLKADKKKSADIKIFTDDAGFKAYAIAESGYTALNNKIIPATVLVAQKTR